MAVYHGLPDLRNKNDQWENHEEWKGIKCRRDEHRYAAEKRQKVMEITYRTHIITDKQVEKKSISYLRTAVVLLKQS